MSSHADWYLYKVLWIELRRFSSYRADTICDRQTDGQTDGRLGKNNMPSDPEGRRHKKDPQKKYHLGKLFLSALWKFWKCISLILHMPLIWNYKKIIEPWHVISNNVAFWQVSIQTSLWSPLLNTDTPNVVQSVALQSENIQATSTVSDQTAGMCRLIWGFAGCTYHIVGNVMSLLNYLSANLYEYSLKELLYGTEYVT